MSKRLPEVIRPEAGRLYTYKGEAYIVTQVLENELTQHRDEWQPTIRYRLDEEATPLRFNRALKDFNAKFVPVPENS